jgi:predicted nucleic acid-binding protein
MSLAFLDTSALMKLYIAEIGSNWLKTFVQQNRVGISELTFYEAATVLRRRTLEGTITDLQALAIYATLQNDSTNYDVLELRANDQLRRVLGLAFNPLGNLRLRALDAIQIAAAQIMSETVSQMNPPIPFVFVSADAQLLRVAQHLGLATDNPENHP